MRQRLICLGLVVLLAVIFKTPTNAQLPAEDTKSAKVASDVAIHNLPTRIMIPEVSIDLPVKKANIINSYWEVFDDVAAWGDESGLPGVNGNQVIFAHSREGLFGSLKDAKVGTEVKVVAGDKEYKYSVVEIKKVLPSDIKVVAPTNDETLTLYTCSDFADSKRLILSAKRIN